MRTLTWTEYLENFNAWAESTRANYVSRIDDFTGAKSADVRKIILRLAAEPYTSRLANKAMDAGVVFDKRDVQLIKPAVNTETWARAKAAFSGGIFSKNEDPQKRAAKIGKKEQSRKTRQENRKVAAEQNELRMAQIRQNKEDFWLGVGMTELADDIYRFSGTDYPA